MKAAAISRTLLIAAVSAATAFPILSSAQEFRFDPEHFRFDRDDRRANEGKRASCSVYAQMAVVQAQANRRYECRYDGPRWSTEARAHFLWCRFVQREALRHEVRDRAEDLQRCFDRMGDFDEEREERREERREDRREDRR